MQGTTLPEARARGERLRDLSTDRAEKVRPGFGDRARTFILAYLRRKGATSSEVLTNAAKRAGITAPDDRAFGGVYATLQRRGLIRYSELLPRFKGHGSIGAKLWKLTAKGAASNG